MYGKGNDCSGMITSYLEGISQTSRRDIEENKLEGVRS